MKALENFFQLLNNFRVFKAFKRDYDFCLKFDLTLLDLFAF